MQIFRVRNLGLALAAVACLSMASAEAKTLKWKLKPGDKLHYALSNKGVNEIDAGGFQLSTLIKLVFDLDWTVKSVDGEGNVTLAQKIDRVKMRVVVPPPLDVDFLYDSKSEEQPEGMIWERMGPMIEALSGGEFTVIMSAAGEIKELKIPESLNKVIEDQKAEAEAGGGGGGGGGGGFMQMLGVGLSEETIKMLLGSAFCTLPVGDASSWERSDEMKMGPIGSMTTKYKYSLDGTEQAGGKSVDKIAAKTDVTFEPNEDSDVDVFLELADQSGQGSTLFDAAAGRIVKADLETKVTMEGDFMGNEFERINTQTTVLVAGTSDDLPADPSDTPPPEKKEETKEPAAAGAK